MSLKTKEAGSKIEFDLDPKKIEDLYRRIERSSSEYLLGRVPLESPLKELEITLKTQKRQFSLTAQIKAERIIEGSVVEEKHQEESKQKRSFFLDSLKKIFKIFKRRKVFKVGDRVLVRTDIGEAIRREAMRQKKEDKKETKPTEPTGAKVSIPLGFLKERFKVRKIKDLVVVLDGNERYEYALHNGGESVLHHIPYNIFAEVMGGQPPSLQDQEIVINAGEDEKITLAEKSIKDLKEFSKELHKFFELLKATLEGIYTEQKVQVPDILFLLRPKKLETRERDSDEMGPFERGGALEKAIEAENPQISFEEIGGLKKAKEEIQGLCFALTNPALYEKWGTKPPKGILLYGPPGTGKTLLAKALASAVNARFYHVKVTDINSVWHSYSEKHMQQVFDIAKESQPSIIFIDEIDALASSRDSLDGINRKVVSVLLENLSGMDSSDNVIVVASTNRPDDVDPAIKRAGRFDRLIEVGNPDEGGRREIFVIHTSAAEKIAKRKLFAKLDYNALTQRTERMCGADIREIIRRTLEGRVRSEGAGKGKNTGSVTTKDISKQIESYERIKKEKKRAGFTQ